MAEDREFCMDYFGTSIYATTRTVFPISRLDVRMLDRVNLAH